MTTFQWPLVSVTHPLVRRLWKIEDRFAEQKSTLALGWTPLLSVGEHGCFPAAPASLPALSTAVALRNAARRRENALQPDTEELRAVAHLSFPLVAGCELLGE